MTKIEKKGTACDTAHHGTVCDLLFKRLFYRLKKIFIWERIVEKNSDEKKKVVSDLQWKYIWLFHKRVSEWISPSAFITLALPITLFERVMFIFFSFISIICKKIFFFCIKCSFLYLAIISISSLFYFVIYTED